MLSNIQKKIQTLNILFFYFNLFAVIKWRYNYLRDTIGVFTAVIHQPSESHTFCCRVNTEKNILIADAAVATIKKIPEFSFITPKLWYNFSSRYL